MSATNEKNAMVPAEGFAALAGMDTLMEEMGDELQGLEFSLDKVKFPSAGSTAFAIPTPDGEDSDMVKELVCVITHQHPAFAFYATDFTGGHAAPDCSSIDGKVGYGVSGGTCRNCPKNQYGSGKNGKSKACQNKRMLYVLREGELFPIMLLLPPGSLKAFTNYVKSLLSRGLRVYQVVTKITLKKVRNDDGIEYSQAVFKMERPLTPEERAAVLPVCETAKAYSLRMTPDTIADDDVPFVDAETGEIVTPLN